jgi:hypothetical protein
MPSLAVSADAKLSSQRSIKTILLVVLFCFTHIHAAAAADTFTLTQNQQLNFGTLQIPSSGSQNFGVNPVGGTAGNGTLLYGIPANGDYTIKCTGTCTSAISLSITSGSTCTGLTSIGSWLGNYNNGGANGALPFSGLANPGASGKDFKVGAGATYTSSATAGTCTPTFTINLTETGTTNFTENASIGFDVGLALNKNSDINFGTVTAANASTYRISTAGAVSTVSGTGTQIYGTTSAGSITITGSASDTITISAGSYTANNGVTPSNATCSYKGAAATACLVTGAAPGSGTTLLLGVDVAADGSQAAGTTAAPTFVVSATYN